MKADPVRWVVGLVLAAAMAAPAQTRLFVSEYANGNIKAFDYTDGSSVTLPAAYSPVGGLSSGADGMVTDGTGRLYVNRENGTIWRRSADGNSFSQFAIMPGASSSFNLLDLTRDSQYLYGARFGTNTIYRTSLADGTVTTITGPDTADRFDGVRIGPDGRLYAVDSSDGEIYAYDFSTSSWSTFLAFNLAGDASQMEFGSDGKVFLSRTISGQARIYAYSLNVPGDYSSGLNTTATLIGSFGSYGGATGIRIGPDNRLYANAFNAGEVWRSNGDITAMESAAFISGLNSPASLYFAAVPEPGVAALIAPALLVWGWLRRQRRS